MVNTAKLINVTIDHRHLTTKRENKYRLLFTDALFLNFTES